MTTPRCCSWSGRAPATEDELDRDIPDRELIEQALPYQLQAETCLVFGADGIRCRIALPIAA